MTTPAKIAVIVPIYGEFEFAFKCLDSLVRHTTDYQCIVIDDGSPGWTDAVRAEIERIVPCERLHFERFEPNRGLTAAWNRGLELARQFGNSYAALVNSDTLFTPGWLVRTLTALDQVDLMGPMSNAPGEHQQQQIQRLLRDYRPDDSPQALADLSWRLRDKYTGQIRPGVVNGFWFAAKTKTWWDNAFDATHVFNPANRLVGNENEFQKRFRGKIGAAADVFIFHYRSVSRGLENVDPQYNIGAFRPAAAVEKISASAPPAAGGQGGTERRPLHVCFVCEEFPPAPHGGSGSSYRDLAYGLVAAGHRVTVVGIYQRKVLAALPAEQPMAGLRVVRLAATPNGFGWKFRMRADRWRLRRWLDRAHRREKFDVIEASDYYGWLPQGGPAGAVTVVRMRGSNLFFDQELNRIGSGALEHRLERQTVMRATALAAVSHYAARRTLDLCGQPARPVTVLYNAVDPELFSPSATVPVEPGLVVYVNSLNPKKGIEQLVDAMNTVCAKHPHARLVVIGADTQPASGGRSYLDQLKERVQREFRGRVEFTGRLPQSGVVEYLRRAQICCLPSHMETFGIAAVEAMSVGKAVVYSRTGPGPEVLEDGVSGLLCDPFAADDVAEKISRLLADPALAATLGRGARARVLARFDKKGWIDRNVDYYHRCREAL